MYYILAVGCLSTLIIVCCDWCFLSYSRMTDSAFFILRISRPKSILYCTSYDSLCVKLSSTFQIFKPCCHICCHIALRRFKRFCLLTSSTEILSQKPVYKTATHKLFFVLPRKEDIARNNKSQPRRWLGTWSPTQLPIRQYCLLSLNLFTPLQHTAALASLQMIIVRLGFFVLYNNL